MGKEKKKGNSFGKKLAKSWLTMRKRMRLLDFDSDFYLQINHDVRAAGLDPFRHWVEHGQFEGRAKSRSDEVRGLISLAGGAHRDASKPTLLVVSHEASRTGAPILALNLARRLKQTHNVVVLLLKNGPLVKAFASESIATYVLDHDYFWSAAIAPYKIRAIHPDINAAFVNSVVSFPVVLSLKSQGVKIISLIHEFASYIKPASILRDMLRDSDVIVFSAPIIQKDAIRVLGDLGAARVVILPQGKCDVNETPATLSVEALKVRDYLSAEKVMRKIVLGAGSVGMRKGVDLFIQCAASLKARHPELDVLFVWAGHGYDPERDVGYSVYLEDQVRRSGLEQSFKFLGELDDINVAYQMSDVMWLTSRLDPLPNVGIDAICLGLPIVCFENASGIADILMMAGLESSCVAKYIDVNGLAFRTAEILINEHVSHAVSDALKRVGEEHFNFDKYADNLRELV